MLSKILIFVTIEITTTTIKAVRFISSIVEVDRCSKLFGQNYNYIVTTEWLSHALKLQLNSSSKLYVDRNYSSTLFVRSIQSNEQIKNWRTYRLSPYNKDVLTRKGVKPRQARNYSSLRDRPVDFQFIRYDRSSQLQLLIRRTFA